MKFDVSQEELYSVPIEKLNLSVKTYKLFKRESIVSVGDCIDAFVFSGIRMGFDIQDEILAKVIEYLYDNHMIDTHSFRDMR